VLLLLALLYIAAPPAAEAVVVVTAVIFVRTSSMQSLASRRNASIASTFREVSAVSAMMIHVAAMPAMTSSADMFRKVSMT